MALAPFFSRTYSAIGAHLGITRKELETVLRGRLVGIHLGEACTKEGNDKWIAELLVNLLARLYPTLSITGDDDACKAASRLAKSINPDIKIVSESDKEDITAFVGASISKENGFLVDAEGWVAYVGNSKKLKKKKEVNPYASGAAAALAVWRVFQTIVAAKTEAFPDITLSLLDYSSSAGATEELPAVNLGEVAIAGVGAVGNPALWAWSKHDGLKGTFHLIDPEDVELSNLQRYCLPLSDDVGMGKVQLAERALQGTKLKYKLWPCTIEDFASNYSEIGELPTICISVDNIDGRRTAQALLPRLAVNGWTSDSGLGASWHRFDNGNACLACFYHPKGTILSQTELAAQALGIPHEELAALWVTEQPLERKHIHVAEKHLGLPKKTLSKWKGKRVQDVYSGVICGQIGLDLSGVGHVATVPLAHQSVLSGILMAAELVKRSDPALEAKSQKEPLVIWDDVMRTPPKYWVSNRLKEPECFCGDQIYQDVYKEKWGG